jgi:hypothetical protein
MELSLDHRRLTIAGSGVGVVYAGRRVEHRRRPCGQPRVGTYRLAYRPSSNALGFEKTSNSNVERRLLHLQLRAAPGDVQHLAGHDAVPLVVLRDRSDERNDQPSYNHTHPDHRDDYDDDNHHARYVVLCLAAVVWVPDAAYGNVGVPVGTTLTPSGTVDVTTDGTVINGMDVSGETDVNATDNGTTTPS